MKVLVLTGPESSGKSWLAAEIQARFGGVVVGEYVRHFIDRHQRDTCYADIDDIARGQLAWEDAARAARPALLILDTHLLSNLLWVIWGWHAEAWALITLQVCLALMNLRGVKKNDAPTQPEPDAPRA